MYQFIFGNLFPRCFARIDDYGIESKTEFNIHYKNYLSQKCVFEWQQKNSNLSSLNNLDDEMNSSANSTLLNVTKLNHNVDKEEEIEIKHEMVDPNVDGEVFIINKKKVIRKKLKKEEKDKINAENKIKKRNEKKRKLEEKLIENAEKLKKLKKTK